MSHKNQPVVFIHGLSGSKNNFQYLQKYFKHTKSFDLPGFGQAAKPKAPYDINFFLKYLETQIREPSIIVGHSLGAILAKEFAIKHPKLVKKIYMISYPLAKTPKDLCTKINQGLMGKMFIKQDMFSMLLCHSKIIWKWPILLFAYLFKRKNYLSIRDYFLHSYQAETLSIQNVLLKEDINSLNKIKTKIIMIAGENDRWINKSLLKNFPHYNIPDMGHVFLGHEKKISEIIKSNPISNS